MMPVNNPNRPLWKVFAVCLITSTILIILGFFSYLLKGWLTWDFEKPFPFGSIEIVTILKISLLGIPTGLVFWFLILIKK
jgi:hypothetical protein